MRRSEKRGEIGGQTFWKCLDITDIEKDPGTGYAIEGDGPSRVRCCCFTKAHLQSDNDPTQVWLRRVREETSSCHLRREAISSRVALLFWNTKFAEGT